MTRIDSAYMLAHCKGELGRGKPERCPRSWLIRARVHASLTGDHNAGQACSMALAMLRGTLPANGENVGKMATLAGRRAGGGRSRLRQK